jgi:hypothetical protein
MTASGGHAEQQPIIVHNPAWNKWAMGFAAIGFFTPEFIIRPTDATLIFFNFFGGVSLLFTLIFARNQISLVGNRFSIRGLIVRKSVSLDLLTSISAYPTRGKFPYWNFRLCDQGGNSATINFDGFRADDRMRLLAAIEPWARRPGVRHEGPTDLALAGKLWWPRAAAPYGPVPVRDRHKHDPPRHAR